MEKTKKIIGMKKLKYFCQVCEKQCGNDIGFRRHTESESHIRRILVFKDNSAEMLGDYSSRLEREFLTILKRYGTKQMNANNVYQEYISDKGHIHMNATKWDSLTSFVRYLGSTEQCIIEYKDEQWWLSYIDHKKSERERIANERKALVRDNDTLSEQFQEKQLEAAKRRHVDEVVDASAGLIANVPRSAVNAVLLKKDSDNKAHLLGKSVVGVFSEDSDSEDTAVGTPAAPSAPTEPVFEPTDNWVRLNLIVKILNQDIGDGVFYCTKGLVTAQYAFDGENQHEIEHGGCSNMRDDRTDRDRTTKQRDIPFNCASVAEVECFDKTRVQLPIDELETVIPEVGGEVAVVKGRYSDKHEGAQFRATVVRKDSHRQRVEVKLESRSFGRDQGKQVHCTYDEICKTVYSDV